MADRVFLGFFGLNTEALGAEALDLSSFGTTVTIGPDRTPITVAATFGLDHTFELMGSTSCAASFRIERLSAANALVFTGHYKNNLLIEGLWRPLAGVASATNLETRVQGYLTNHPVAMAGGPDDLNVWEGAFGNVVGYSVTDGTTTHTFGTLLST